MCFLRRESTSITYKRGEYFNYLITPVFGHSFFVCENCERRLEGFALIIHTVVVRRSRSEQGEKKVRQSPTLARTLGEVLRNRMKVVKIA